MSQAGSKGWSEQRKRTWLVFTPAYVLAIVTGSVLMHRLSEPLGWVLAGVVGALVYLGASQVLNTVVRLTESRPPSG